MIENPKLNASGCHDITAYQAICNVSREEKRHAKAKSTPEKIYVCSPFSGDTGQNIEKALEYCRFALKRGKFPIAPHCYLPRFMDDNNPDERELAVSFGLRLLFGCQELWVFGSHISDGMQREIHAARQRCIKIRQFTEKMDEIKP